MAINTNVVSVKILTPDATEARFSLSIFGLPTRHFYTSPGGGNEIRLALKRANGLDGYISSPFLVRQVYEEELKP